MSLAQQIAARMLARKSTAAAPAPRVVSPTPRHTSPQAYNSPKVPRAERRVRQSLGQVFRNAPSFEEVQAIVDKTVVIPPPPKPAPVRTSAQPKGPRSITERPPPLPPRPPRAELEVDLVKVLEALPLPAAPPASSTPTRGRGSCFAIDAETGRQCRLPAHPEAPDRHGHERGPFFRCAVPGQTFTRRDLLDHAATRHNPEAP